MKKIFVLLQFLLLSCSAFGMQTKEKPPRPEVPADISREILQFIMSHEDFNKAIDAIKNYAIIDPRVETSLEITEFIMKEFAKRWVVDLIDVAMELDTKGAQEWLASDAAKKWLAENQSRVATLITLPSVSLAKTKILLDLDADPDAPEGPRSRQTPLIEAIIVNNIPRIKLLLDAGADPNLYKDDPYYNPLIVTLNYVYSHADQLKILKLLLDAGANLNSSFIHEVEYTTTLNYARKLLETRPDLKEAVNLLEKYAKNSNEKIIKEK